MKLARAANLSPKSQVRTIFLPSSSHVQINANYPRPVGVSSNVDDDLFDREENYLRKLEPSITSLAKMIAQVNRKELKRREGGLRSTDISKNSTKTARKHRRRNDKYLHRRPTTPHDQYWKNNDKFTTTSVDYVDCVAVGWGKFTNSGDLSDALLKIEVPIQNIKRCVEEKTDQVTSKKASSGNLTSSRPLKPNLRTIHLISHFRCEEVYSDFVSLHQSQHLCAGNMDGRGGTCVGDSGGGLQCKIDRNGPWILVGITSFGSGCAKAGYPDVYTNVASYRKWIDNVIRNN